MTITIRSARDCGNDLLYIRAESDAILGPDGLPNELTAQGHVSALTNYPDQPEVTNADGSVKTAATFRVATADEAQAYYTQLIGEAYPETRTPAQAIDLLTGLATLKPMVRA